MKNKFVTWGIIALAAVIGFTMMACASSQPLENVPPYTYTGENPIYPAVIQAIDNGNSAHWGNSTVYVTDPNEIIINNVRTTDALFMADFTLKISLENNVVTYQFSDRMTRSPLSTDPRWSSIDSFAQSDRELIFINYFNTEIPKVMEDEALYAAAKEKADTALGGAPVAKASNAPIEAVYALPLQNPQNLLLYPAVGAAVTDYNSNLIYPINLTEIDCLGNEFTIERVLETTDPRTLRVSRERLKIKLAYRDNQLNIDLTGSNPIRDAKETADQLKTTIEQTLTNPAAYSEAKKAFLKNNTFLYMAFAPVTNIIRDEFVKQLFMDGEIGLYARVSDVRKNENAEFRNYTAEIRATLYSEKALTGGSFAHITLYTSDVNLARLKQGENTTLSGKLVRMDYSGLDRRFIMTK